MAKTYCSIDHGHDAAEVSIFVATLAAEKTNELCHLLPKGTTVVKKKFAEIAMAVDVGTELVVAGSGVVRSEAVEPVVVLLCVVGITAIDEGDGGAKTVDHSLE